MIADAHAELSGLHEQVLSRLGPALVSGELTEGTIVTVDEIARQSNVSRTVARDAVKVPARHSGLPV